MSIVCANDSNAEVIASIVSESNKSVARLFGIDERNNPKHPSFYTQEWVLSDFDRGEEYFLFLSEGSAVACVAFEHPRPNTAYLNRLSVMPA